MLHVNSLGSILFAKIKKNSEKEVQLYFEIKPVTTQYVYNDYNIKFIIVSKKHEESITLNATVNATLTIG